jgi:hypothetical protein
MGVIWGWLIHLLAILNTNCYNEHYSLILGVL